MKQYSKKKKWLSRNKKMHYIIGIGLYIKYVSCMWTENGAVQVTSNGY